MATEAKSVEVSDSNLEQEVLQSQVPVLVDLGADWCPPCKAISPIADTLSSKYAGKTKIAKLDVDANLPS
jgi:thioredoxin 1